MENEIVNLRNNQETENSKNNEKERNLEEKENCSLNNTINNIKNENIENHLEKEVYSSDDDNENNDEDEEEEDEDNESKKNFHNNSESNHSKSQKSKTKNKDNQTHTLTFIIDNNQEDEKDNKKASLISTDSNGSNSFEDIYNENRIWYEKYISTIHPGSIRASIFSLSILCMGTGCLILPLRFSQLSIVFCFLEIILIGFLANWTLIY